MGMRLWLNSDTSSFSSMDSCSVSGLSTTDIGPIRIVDKLSPPHHDALKAMVYFVVPIVNYTKSLLCL